MNIDWVKKLTSRKFWVAIAGFVSGLLLLNKVDADTADKIGGIIMAFGSVVGYIFGEGLIDAAMVNTTPVIAPKDEE